MVMVMMVSGHCGSGETVGLCDLALVQAVSSLIARCWSSTSHCRANFQAYESFLLVASKRDVTVQWLANVLNRYAARMK